MQTKQELRSDLRGKRARQSAADIEICSQRIAERAVGLPIWRDTMLVHVYSPHAAWGELDPAPLVAVLSARFPAMRFRWGTLEESAVPRHDFDVIIVPVLGFDTNRYRLGLGKGWYDRFLAAQPHAYSVGLAYRWAAVSALPHEPHDIPLDAIVTD